MEKRLYGLAGTYARYTVAPKTAKALRAWAKANGFELADDPHVTTVYSKVPLPAYQPADWGFAAMATGVELFGPNNDALALTFRPTPDMDETGNDVAPLYSYGEDQFCWRHREAERLGATWDYPEYRPHLTVFEGWSGGTIPEPPPFALEFDKEVVSDLKEPGSEDTVNEFEATTKITKVDEDRRLVGGWVSVVHDGTAPVVDSQGDVIDLDDLRDAVHEFVAVRVGKAMHAGEQVAELVEIVIVDDVLRKALGAPAGPTGAWAVWKVTDDKVWKRVKSGELAAFSIGGRGVREPIVA